MNITTKLNGITYLIVEVFSTVNRLDYFTEKAKRHDAIYQGIVKYHSGGFFTKPYVILRILVPEKNIVDFNNESN